VYCNEHSFPRYVGASLVAARKAAIFIVIKKLRGGIKCSKKQNVVSISE
jgi:hypothetical protein